jgi:hypothetical protein
MAAQLGERKALPARRRSRVRGGLAILSGVFYACATVAVILALFALAGDRIGLWDPVKPAALPAASSTPKKPLRTSPKKHLRASKKVKQRARVSHGRPVKASPQPPIGPPLPAGSAFLLAAAAAALAALTSVGGRRALSRGVHGGRDALARGARASRSRRPRVTGFHLREPGAVNVRFISPAAGRPIRIGATAIEAVKTGRLLSRASSPRSRRTATSEVRSAPRSALAVVPAELTKLVHIVGRDGPAAREAVQQATALRLRQAMRSYMRLRHQTQAATYAISVVISVMVGWLVVLMLSN